MNRFGLGAKLAMGVLCSLTIAGAGAAQNPALGPPGEAATRSVAKYLGLERDLQAALDGARRATLEAMVDPEFELRLPASPDTHARDEWLKGGAGKVAAGARVRDLAVLETDDLATVSFLLETRGARYFVVDVWRQSSSKLQARFMSVPANPPPRRSKPDGRE